jgi:hypothetical protein
MTVRGIGAARVILLGGGVVLAGWGLTLLWDNTPAVLLRIAMWALIAVVLHDAVFAPLCVAIGWGGRRLLPATWWAPVAVAGLCTVVLLALAVPVFDKPGQRPDNVTVLDRDYPRGLWISLALVWVAVPIYLLVARWSPVRQDEVIERERADNVEGEPPSA